MLEWLLANSAIILVLALTVTALLLFATEVIPIEVTALGVLVVLGVSGVLNVGDALSGFSNEATITVLMMFLLSAAVLYSGIIDWLGDRMGVLVGRSAWRQVLVIGLVAGPVSAFINNTAAVAVMIPLAIRLAQNAGTSPSKLLMPLSFAAMLGGTMTLVGTSTNLLGSALRDKAGYGHFGIFEFTAVGVIVFGVGMLYLTTIGAWLVPARIKARKVDEQYALREFIGEVLVQEGSVLVGKRAGEDELSQQFDAEVLQVARNTTRADPAVTRIDYQVGDRVLIRCSRANLQRIADSGVALLAPPSSGLDEDLGSLHFRELLVPPTSDVRGRHLGALRHWRDWGVHPVALLSRGRFRAFGLRQHVLQPGDIVLTAGSEEAVKPLSGGEDFHVLGGPATPVRRPHKAPWVIGVLALVIFVSAVGWLPIVLSSTAGVVALVALGAIRPDEMYRNVNWNVILLLAGMIPLGIALQQSGAAALLADLVAQAARSLPPVGMLALVFFATSLLTEVLSNNASIVLVVPVAVELAHNLGLEPTPFILAAMFAASTSFLSPIGYQTNLMVLGPGGYRYLDYLRVGGPLNLLLLVVTPFAINHFFPLQ